MKMTKKLTATVLAVLLVCSAFVFSAIAADAVGFKASVSASAYAAQRGDEVVFTVSINDITAEDGLIGVDIPLRYDENVFEFVKLETVYPSAWGNSGYYGGENEPTDGAIWLRAWNDGDSFASDAACKTWGKAFKVTLRVLDTAADGETTVTVVGESDYPVLGTAGDGIASRVVGQGSSTTVAIGDIEIMYGDINGDGKVNSFDASLALQYEVALIDLNATQLLAGDVSGDGKINSFDASCILRYEVGLLKAFPVENK